MLMLMFANSFLITISFFLTGSMLKVSLGVDADKTTASIKKVITRVIVFIVFNIIFKLYISTLKESFRLCCKTFYDTYYLLKTIFLPFSQPSGIGSIDKTILLSFISSL